MLNANKALVGNRRYLSTGTSPNKGQVSAKGAQGYLRRELGNRQQLRQQRLQGGRVPNLKGGDGRSDMRSGVAARALQGQLGRRPANGQLGGKPGIAQDPRNGGSGPRPVMPGQPGAVGEQPQQPEQYVTVNDDGTLQLPYNQAFAEDQYAAVDEANQQLMAMNEEFNQQQMEYTQGKRDARLGYDQQKRTTLNNNAAGGTAFSSMYGTGVANNAQAYANQVGDLESANTNFKLNQDRQRAAIQSALNAQMGRAVQQYGVELGEQAGSLGYGTAGGGQGRKGIKKGKDRRKKNRPSHTPNVNKNKGKGKNTPRPRPRPNQQVTNKALQESIKKWKPGGKR